MKNDFLKLAPTDATACNEKNKGRCECANVLNGFQTYTFWIGDIQRCFTVYHPLSRINETLPIVFSGNCYAKDKLRLMDSVNENSKGKKSEHLHSGCHSNTVILLCSKG